MISTVGAEVMQKSYRLKTRLQHHCDVNGMHVQVQNKNNKTRNTHAGEIKRWNDGLVRGWRGRLHAEGVHAADMLKSPSL